MSERAGVADGSTPPIASARRSKLPLVAIAVIAFAPVIASYVAYHYFPREARVNYGELVATRAPAIEGTRPDGAPFSLADFRGRWVLLIVAGARCDATCERMLYATRQARTMQGREQDRLVRAVVATGGESPQADLVAKHPGLVFATSNERSLAALPVSNNAIYVVDPLGNLVLRYSDDPDIKRLAKDLERVLRASSIG
jgi:cytochrome oxidase Cu insertion factor (SCO1/SenC/PrrC family)